MLVNLTPNLKEIERRRKIAQENGFEFIPQNDPRLMQYGDGIYQCNIDFNFGLNEFMEFDPEKGMFRIPFEQAYESFRPTYHKAQYGVADSVEQLKEYFREEIQDPDRKYFLTLTPVFQDKENKGKGGGWRWHKWGEYIGNLNPRCECLDDEDFGDDFQYVICFHLYELK